MLRAISISNYALIANLHINFQSGFSVITGETGAGKSIILGALGLIMGQRADVQAISEGETKCIIEADFDISTYQLQSFFSTYDLDYEATHCIIRRELSSNGKSRCFVNDTPVTLTILKELTSNLIDIHSQHENLLLSSDRFQLNIVDTIAKNSLLKKAYKTAYENNKTITEKLHALKEIANAQRTEADYLAFQYNQLAEAHLREDELAELEEELNQLQHAEEIKTELKNCFSILDNENGTIGLLTVCCAKMQKISSYMSATKELAERIESTNIELKDIAADINNLAEQTEYNLERQQFVEERVNLLYSLLQKHRLQTIKELIALRDELEQKLHRIESYDSEIAALEKQQKQATVELQKQAEILSNSRKNVKTTICKQVTEPLKTLGIPHPQFDIYFGKLPHYTENGIDDVQFLFSANKNQSLHNVAQVASGGEISRLMLCIKALIADSQALPTIIFDEIDTGISGEVADSMGNIMQNMATNMQVISVTHLPQIAAKGVAHYLVYKKENTTRTETNIKYLQPEERIQEIAQMLSGAHITSAAIENAKNLLGIVEL